MASMYLDDIIINDTSGDFNNSWPNCQKIVLLRPSADGDASEWQRAIDNGHNYDQVNNVPTTSTDYVYTYDIYSTDLYGVENLPAEADTVCIVRPDAWAYKSSGNPSNMSRIAFLVKSGTTVGSSPALDLPIFPDWVHYAFDSNPITGAQWTKEEVNNMQAGFESR